MEKASGGVSARDLDTRLLRFRNRPTTEDARALAAELLEAGRGTEALEVVAMSLAESPEDGGLHLLEGQAWLCEGDLIRAQAAFLKAARCSPRDKEPFRWLGEVLLKRGDPHRAVKVLERASAIDPNDRAIQLLYQRAERFSRIAASDGSAEAAAALRRALGRPEPDGHSEENTVVAAEVSRRLAEQMRYRWPPPGPDRPRLAPHPPNLEDFDDEDMPTTIAAREAGPPLPPIRSPKAPRQHERTMLGVGAPGAAHDKKAEPSPPAAPTLPKPSSPRAKRTMVGLGQQPAKPATSTPDAVAGRGAQDFGSDPFAAEAAFDDVTTDARKVPAAPPPMPPPPAPPFPRGSAPADSPPFGASPAPEPAPPGFQTGGEPPPGAFDRLDDKETRPAPDVGGGEHAGEAESVDAILRMLERDGIFEPPSAAPAQWASREEARGVRTRIGRPLAAVWVVALLLAGGGWFAWRKWVEHRHAEAARLVEEARGKALRGDHQDLVDAERTLRLARDLNAHDETGPAELIFVHAQRVLEDGAFQPGYLRPAIRRGERMEVDPGRVDAASAVLAVAEGDTDGARGKIASALEASPEDAAVLYIAGRVEQRLGDEDALEHLAAAVEKEPALSAAAIALAEARADEGRWDEAIELLDGVLERYPEHLRATLWKTFLTADEADPDEGLARVEQSEERLEVGAPTDRVLTELTRARLLRRKGELDAAARAVDRAGEAGATEPRLLALVASEAEAVGRLAFAQAAAANAVAAAPTNADFRKLLAQVLLDRGDGVRALRTLAALSMEDPEVLRMSAEAALMVGTPDALQAAAEALGSHIEETEEPSVEMRALRIRTLVALGRGREVLRDARQLASDAPGDPVAARALGEAALASFEGGLATEAFGRLVQALPDDPDGHYLLGRAHRLASNAEEAERSFRRAIELLPAHTDAQLALGRLLLDQGKYEEADELYQELARQSGIVAGTTTALLGRLGRVEALIGLGRLEDATVQMESVRSEDRETAIARIAAARLALAKNQPGEAVTALRPIAEGESPPADVVAMFGDALFDAGEVEAANQQYERALQIDRGLPEALLGKAKVAVRAENTRDARHYLERVEEALDRRIRPPRMRAMVQFLRGRSAIQEGRNGRDRAREALRAAVQIPGVPAEAWFWLGEALSGDNAPEARAAYERYLEIDPDGPYASRARRAIR